MLQLQTEAQRVHREVKLSILAAMETGAHDRARTVLTEYEAVSPHQADSLRADVIAAYGISL